MTSVPRVIIDCDPGHDDAIALLVAARHTEILGVTTVAGNVSLDSTTRNARIVLDLLGVNAPLHRGAARPLVAPPRHAESVHGASGLDGADLPPPSRPADSSQAVDFIVETCRQIEGLWLVPTGPLTNVALAMRAAPDLTRRIAGISLMGGGTFGNVTAVGEFNVWADPEAAAEVFAGGANLMMCGLDVTHRLQATPSRIDSVRNLPGTLAQTFAQLLTFYSGGEIERNTDMHGAPVHDACAVLALTHPHLFTMNRHHVEVETHGSSTQGMTVIDRRSLRERPDPNCTVVWNVDAERAFDVIVESIATFSH
jgi:inosine-uridine nucleoside N-ribohydrolase